MNEQYYAILTVKEFPTVKRSKEKMADWLRKCADEIENSDHREYVKSPRFRMVKPYIKNIKKS